MATWQSVAPQVPELFPHTPLRLFVEVLGAVIEPVLQGTCQIGIVGSLPVLPEAMHSELLLDVPLVTVVAPTHPLAVIQRRHSSIRTAATCATRADRSIDVVQRPELRCVLEKRVAARRHGRPTRLSARRLRLRQHAAIHGRRRHRQQQAARHSNRTAKQSEAVDADARGVSQRRATGSGRALAD